MQSWEKGTHGDETRGWEPMENGAGGSHWKPKKTLHAAARHCAEWTGFIGIPAMQVIDLHTGEVVWRDSRQYPDAGEPIGLCIEQGRMYVPSGLPDPDAEYQTTLDL